MSKPTTRNEDLKAGELIASLIKDIAIDFGDVLEYVQKNFEPDVIFDDDELDAWALANGYTKEK